MGYRTYYHIFLSAERQKEANSVYTSLSKNVRGGLWILLPSFRGGSSVCQGMHRKEGAYSGTYTARKTDNATEGDNGV